MDEARTQMQVMGNLFNKNKTNKQTNWLASRLGWTGLDWTGQDWAGHRRHLT